MFDHTITRAIGAGHHHLRVDNTWNKKNIEFDAAAGEEVKFNVVNKAGRFTWWLVGAIGAGPMYVFIDRENWTG